MHKSFPLISIFLLSLIFFQVIPLFLLKSVDQNLPYQTYSTVLVFIVLAILLGYFVRTYFRFPKLVIWRREAEKRNIWRFGELMNGGLFFFSLITSIYLYINIRREGYGNIDISGLFGNVVLYLHLLSLSVLFVSYEKSSVSSKRLIFNLILINLPRLIVSLAGQRFIFVQSFLPTIIFLLTVYKIDFKYYILLGFSSLMVLFLPIITGARVMAEDFLLEFISSTPVLLLSRTDFSMFVDKHFIFSGLSFSLFNIDLFDYKSFYDLGPYKVRFDWILTRELIGSWDEHNMGTGGNPVFELFSEGVVLMFLFSFLLGWLIKSFSQYNSLNLFILPHVTAKLFFFWRGTYVELMDRLLYYVLIYILFMWVFSHFVFREKSE